MFLITGACGYLGRQITEELCRRGEDVAVFALASDLENCSLPPGVQVFTGDICCANDVERAVSGLSVHDLTVIHCVAVISLAWRIEPRVHQVNVLGVQHVIDACLRHHARLIHISSVHSLPTGRKGTTIRESVHLHPDLVKGGYSKTKALGASLVIDAIVNHNLKASIVFPSGILGPGLQRPNHQMTLMKQYLTHRLPCAVKGGFDFADVRDIAAAISTLAQKKALNGLYILSGEYMTIRELLQYTDLACKSAKGRRIGYLPHWVAYLFLPFIRLYDRFFKHRSVITRYSIYTLGVNALFDCSKAKRDLEYCPRTMQESVRDTLVWMEEHGMIEK